MSTALQPIILQPQNSFIEKFSKTKVGKVITSPKTTLVLGGVLATLLTAGAVAPAATGAALRSAPAVAGKAAKAAIPKSVGGAVKGVAAVGVVSGLGVSGVKKVTKKIYKTGKTGGEIIAGKKTIQEAIGLEEGEKIFTKENLGKAAKAAGIIGAGALGVAGVVAAAKKIKEKIKEKIKGSDQPLPVDSGVVQPQPGFTEPQPVGLGGIPVATPTQISPSEAPQSKISPNPISNIIQITLA